MSEDERKLLQDIKVTCWVTMMLVSFLIGMELFG